VTLRAPFPYFGGKSTVAPVIWAALGRVDHYIEPFFGSGAVLLARPDPAKLETINDADGMVANVWRALKADAGGVARHADNPVNEADLHARHLWLVTRRADLTARLMGDPAWFDAQAAGWWIWGASNWIGGGWVSGQGPWRAVNGVFGKAEVGAEAGAKTAAGVIRQIPKLANGTGVKRQMPVLSRGHGIQSGGPPDFDSRAAWVDAQFAALGARLAEVRVACGDWTRVLGPSILTATPGTTGIFLDPPYDLDRRDAVYALEAPVAADVGRWCLAHGPNPALRIVLAGYDGEHNVLEDHGWRVHAWRAQGGYANQGARRGRDNARAERLWLSPACQLAAQGDLF
jgi:DNA adenine methylase